MTAAIYFYGALIVAALLSWATMELHDERGWVMLTIAMLSIVWPLAVLVIFGLALREWLLDRRLPWRKM